MRKLTFVILKVFAHTSEACLSGLVDVFVRSPRALLNNTLAIVPHPLHNLPSSSLLHRRGHQPRIRITETTSNLLGKAHGFTSLFDYWELLCLQILTLLREVFHAGLHQMLVLGLNKTVAYELVLFDFLLIPVDVSHPESRVLQIVFVVENAEVLLDVVLLVLDEIVNEGRLERLLAQTHR